ncbi:hypothetical protein CY35_14G090000 [Sphagnum magellanicum]|nr:hypothetical protein CY35_14G090000 [Sphagnum magellanicum]KAH9541933.1 hypothetical protein CY35_14G090000 [Sphagnum magellanicum]KAH9541934.1 hypothetical protein CY35_14G090000 [Sphagnum magellanicum]
MLNFEVMDKFLGFSMASLLITILGVLCNLSVLAAISPNPQVPGSLFINCGSNVSYVDSVTQIPWVPDDQYITTGVKGFVQKGLDYYPDYSEMKTLRYFPNPAHLKYCYNLPVIPNSTYQVRATFFYGDYDVIGSDFLSEVLLPDFELAIDATIVGSNFITDFEIFQYAEYWVLTQTNVMSLCLSRVPSSNTNPFITAISLVPIYPNINSTAYEYLYGGGHYHTQFRWNFGGSGLLRYPDDPRDNYWDAQPWNSTSILTTRPPMQTLTGPDGLNPQLDAPAAVLDTALTTNGTMTITFPCTQSYMWYMFLYCVELDPTANATSREFYATIQYSPSVLINPFAMSPNHAVVQEYWGGVPWSITLFQNSSTSTKNGPLVNALELYEIMLENVNLLTNEQDALAIEGIKTSYPQLAEWTGDPCLPYPHPWVTCNTINASINNPFIIAVNLSGYNLTGPISPSFVQLTNLTSLALDNNFLSGSLPDFSNLLHLINLNLNHNQLNGSIPPSIWGIFNLSVLDLSQNQFSGNLIPTYMETPFPTSLTKLNLDHNYFNETLNMLTWDQDDLLHEVFIIISMVNNDISGLEPSWDDKSLVYSPVLLGGNPICNNLQISSNPQISYHQQLNCRYNNSVLNILVQPKSQATKDTILIWILFTTLSLSLIIGGIICVVIFLKYKKNTLTLREIQKEFEKQQVQPTIYSYSVLKLATRDFHQDNELGKGGFGVVYKGCLADGTKVAVKLLTTKSDQGIDDFLNEVVSLTGITHKNLVKLKGCCIHQTQLLLVYEFLENKDLAEVLWGCGIQGISFLDWPTRFKICVGIARGLTYLHEDLQPCIIHRDIKASNILLDNNLNAKITDFGLARLFSQDQSHLFTNVKVGTFGYMSPEYASYGELSTKVDVYSFGVLMLEIISGRKCILNFTSTSQEKINLVKWAWILQKSNLLNDLIDQKMTNTLVANELQLVINVALLCVQNKIAKRPVMSHVLAMLEGKMDIPSSLFAHESDIPQDTTTSTTEGDHLLAYIMSSTQLKSDIELTNLHPK